MYSDEEFGRRFAEALGSLNDEEVVEFTTKIKNQYVGLPRASSIGSCARQQFHKLTGRSITDPTDDTGSWSTMMGYAAQEVVGLVLARMGYEVTRPELDEDDLISGHLDFELCGLDLDEVYVVDVKVRNLYGFRDMVKNGPDIATVAQMQVYLASRRCANGLLLVLPHDLSSWRVEVKKYKLELATPLIQRFLIEENVMYQQHLRDRAQALLTARALDLLVNREFDPSKDKFPCGWCETRTHCYADDLEVSAKPELLFVIPGVVE